MNMSSSMGRMTSHSYFSYEMENNPDGWNHQPDPICFVTCSIDSYIFPWFSHDCPMIVPCSQVFSHDFAMSFHDLPQIFPWQLVLRHHNANGAPSPVAFSRSGAASFSWVIFRVKSQLGLTMG